MITASKQRKRREALGITIRELGRRCGMSKAGVMKRLREGGLPSNPLVARVWCEALGLDQSTGEPLP